ncbi:MAG: hypothetical protein R3357_09500, partial [Burkholderiales bacterium]|nr:hypothetical protein [Burkholderiales bacterium]
NPGRGKKRYVAEVAGFEDESVRERTTGPDRGSREALLQPGLYLVGESQPIPVLSPYMLGVDLEGEGRKWKNVPIRDAGACLTRTSRACEYESATVALAGRERIPVAGGEIDAVKLEVDVQANCPSCGSQTLFYRSATYWYAPSLKRVVKGIWEGREMTLVAHGGATQATRSASTATQPVQVASAAPSALAFKSGWPKTGDRWVYEATSERAPQPRSYEVRVSGVTGEGVFESVRGPRSSSDWVHVPGPYFIGGQLPLPEFAPYLLDVDERTDPQALRAVTFQRLPVLGSTGRPANACRARAKLAGKERIRVPAGEFDALRIEAEIDYCGEAIMGMVPPVLEMTYWYAPAAKRIVKATQRGTNVERVDVVLKSYSVD